MEDRYVIVRIKCDRVFGCEVDTICSFERFEQACEYLEKVKKHYCKTFGVWARLKDDELWLYRFFREICSYHITDINTLFTK